MRWPSRGPARPRPRLDAPHELLRAVEGLVGRGGAAAGARPAARVRARAPAVPRTEDGGRTFGGPSQVAITASVPSTSRTRRCAPTSSSPRASGAGFALRWAPVEASEAPEPTPPERSPRGSPRRSRRGARGRPSTTSTRARTATSCGSARACCRASPTGRPARSSPRPRRRCPRTRAASATGTTASRGSGTRASRSRRSTSAPARTRRRTSSRS